jgi:hypothetical protein
MRISHTVLSIALGLGLSATVTADSIVHTDKPCGLTGNYQSYADGFMPVRFRRRGEDDVPPSVWVLNVSKGGHFCYLDSKLEEVKLWRPDESLSQTATLVIEDPITFNELATVRFRRNKDTKEWPSKIDLVPGDYMLKIGNASNKVTVHQVPAGEKDKAAWMEKQGCTQQAEMYQQEAVDKSL